MHAVGHRLDGGIARGGFPQLTVEAARFPNRHGVDRLVAMDHVEAKEQRHAKPAFLHRFALRLAHQMGAPDVEEAADATVDDHVEGIMRAGRAGLHQPVGEHGNLAELLAQVHAPDERIDALASPAQFHFLVAPLTQRVACDCGNESTQEGYARAQALAQDCGFRPPFGMTPADRFGGGGRRPAIGKQGETGRARA